jgi:hypothetical protein
MESSSNRTSETPRASIEIGSCPGVASAANTNSPKTRPRRHEESWA